MGPTRAGKFLHGPTMGLWGAIWTHMHGSNILEHCTVAFTITTDMAVTSLIPMATAMDVGMWRTVDGMKQAGL